MSDVIDPDEVEFEFPAGSAPDWRSRFDAVCDAAGVAPRAVVASLAAVVLAVGVAIGLTVLGGPGGERVEDTLPLTRPAETATTEVADAIPDEIVVHVAGAVASPGVYRLVPDARVVDAIDAAGGAGAQADMSRVNLAAPLTDGQQVYVVAIGEDAPASTFGTEPSADGAAQPIDINRASETELEELPGIGPALAAAIVRHREENGPFVAVESLLDVSGIGEAKLAGLRDFATV